MGDYLSDQYRNYGQFLNDAGFTYAIIMLCWHYWLYHTTNKNEAPAESVQCLRTYYMEFSLWVSEDSRLYCNFQVSTKDSLFVSTLLTSFFYDCCIAGLSRLVVGPALNSNA